MISEFAAETAATRKAKSVERRLSKIKDELDDARLVQRYAAQEHKTLNSRDTAKKLKAANLKVLTLMTERNRLLKPRQGVKSARRSIKRRAISYED